MLKALEARLNVLKHEILRLTRQAAECAEQAQQDNYWNLARDLQREARELRSEINRLLNFREPSPEGASDNDAALQHP